METITVKNYSNACPVCSNKDAHIINLNNEEQTLEIKCKNCSENYSFIITQEAISLVIPSLGDEEKRTLSSYIRSNSAKYRKKILISGNYIDGKFVQIKDIIKK